MFLILIFQFSLILLWQSATPLPQASPVSLAREIWTEAGDYLLPIALVAQLVALAYFFWHSKNREELTKALAETKELAETRGKRIGDLEKLVSEKDLTIAAKDAAVLLKTQDIARLEEADETRAKTEFRLRAENVDLENKLSRLTLEKNELEIQVSSLLKKKT